MAGSQVLMTLVNGPPYNMTFTNQNLFMVTVTNTHKPLYNTVHYNTVLDTTQFKDGLYRKMNKCMDIKRLFD